MKVYGTLLNLRQVKRAPNGGCQARSIVAAKTKKAAAEAFGFTTYYMNNWASETWNETEVAVATAKPGTVFYFDQYGDRQWHELREKP
jgi:hypothetical protein